MHELEDKNKDTVKCNHCGVERDVIIPIETVEFLKSCGVSDFNVARIYKEYELSNCYFYSFVKFKCDLCGEGRVLGWEAGNSPPSREVLSPSAEIRFWPSYYYPINKVRICKWCCPDNSSKESRDLFLKKLFIAMQKEEDDNWRWILKNKKL